MRLLQVREKNEEMAKDWILFVSSANLKATPNEIYLAFEMALSRELLDENGKEYNLLPELSNNMTGKLIFRYLECKKNDKSYIVAKEKLKALKTRENAFEEKQRKVNRHEFLKMVFEDLKNEGYSRDAFILFGELEDAGKIKKTNDEKKLLYNIELQKYEQETKAHIREKHPVGAGHLIAELRKKIANGDKLSAVQNRCRSVCVCEYLLAFTHDFKAFLEALK